MHKEISEFQYRHKIHLVMLTWCLDYWYLKNQFIYERNILIPFRADREEIFQNKSNEVSKLSSFIHKNKLKHNSFHLLLSVRLILYTYTAYENYRDASLSSFTHVPFLIKHKLKEPIRKNYSVTFDGQQII